MPKEYPLGCCWPGKMRVLGLSDFWRLLGRFIAHSSQIQISLAPLLLQVNQVLDGLSKNKSTFSHNFPNTQIATFPLHVQYWPQFLQSILGKALGFHKHSKLIIYIRNMVSKHQEKQHLNTQISLIFKVLCNAELFIAYLLCPTRWCICYVLRDD